jgi:SAM-dependent methyltransferase
MDHKPASDAWEQGDAYEQYVGRWSRQVAPRFLDWLDAPAGSRWLDLGCGTGALSAAILDRDDTASVIGVEPSPGFLATAQRRLAGRATLHQGGDTAIPLATGSVDVVVSGLVLNFVPDVSAALAEMARVAVAGAAIAAYVWDYAGQMQLMRHFWDAAVALDPGARALDEGLRFPLCEPHALTQAFVAARLQQVETTAIDIATPFASFDDYWRPFLGGQGPAPSYVASLDAAARQRLRDRLEQRIPANPDGSIAMIARAWAVRGRVGR